MKADLADGRLALSAALFEITKTNARIPDPANPGFNTLGGEQRMRGVSFDVAGMATERLYLASGYAYLDGEVVRGADGCRGRRPDRERAGALGVGLGQLSPHDALRPRFRRSLRQRAVRAKRHQRAHDAELRACTTRWRATRCQDSLAFKLNVTNLTRRVLLRAAAHVAHRAGRPVAPSTFAVNAAY